MKFLELPVKFLLSDPEEIEKYEEMGITIEKETEMGTIFVNPNSISTFNEDSDEHVMLTMNNSLSYTIHLSLDEFKEIINYGK